ncbi:hypothetical protein EC178850_3121, partial [Escherichia coli 178850]
MFAGYAVKNGREAPELPYIRYISVHSIKYWKY